MSRKKQEVWTRQCSDGRACGGVYDQPRFIPDDQDVCDDCLAATYGLERVYEGCSCGHYSEHTGYSTETVLKALRAGLKPVRYYVGQRVEWFDKDGNVTERPRTGEYGHRTYVGVYDGEMERPRAPLEERDWNSGMASTWAYNRVVELNEAS